MYVNDISMLNKTKIYKEIYVKTIVDIQKIIKKANKENRKISIVGSKHSMGGHTMYDDSYYININRMKKMKLLPKNKLRVESGAKFCDIIKYLNKYKKTICSMQSYCNFTIGGSISVNAHGIISDEHLSNTVCELRIINSEGKLIKCNKRTNSKLFKLVMGGYGLFGVIYDCVIKIQDNYEFIPKISVIDSSKYLSYSKKHLKQNNTMKITRVNLSNTNKFMVIKYHKINNKPVKSKLKKKLHKENLKNLFFVYLLSTETFKLLRFKYENIKEKPMDFSVYKTTPNELLYVDTNVVTPYSEYSLFTFILQEYFISEKYFNRFIKEFKLLCEKHLLLKGITLLNVTIRIINKDTNTYLKYAPTKRYSFVLYFKILKVVHTTTFKSLCNKFIDLVLKYKGTFYLPYSTFYTKEQLLKSYPMIKSFIKYKKHYDKNELFNNKFYQYCLNIMK